MLKELILAIIFGALIGFGASSALVTINRHQTLLSTDHNSSTPTSALLPSPSPVLISTPTLIISHPQNESVVTTANITLKGTTSPSSFIIVATTKNSYQTNADTAGSFSVNISLGLGANILKVKSIAPDNSEQNTELLVTYSTAKIE